jgi:hypothetical protein
MFASLPDSLSRCNRSIFFHKIPIVYQNLQNLMKTDERGGMLHREQTKSTVRKLFGV